MKVERVFETLFGFLAMASAVAATLNLAFGETDKAVFFVLFAILTTMFENQAHARGREKDHDGNY